MNRVMFMRDTPAGKAMGADDRKQAGEEDDALTVPGEQAVGQIEVVV